MKKLIGILMLVSLLLVSICGVAAAAEADTLVISARDVTGRAGQTVVITLNVEENPGFSGIMFYPAFPENTGEWDFEVKAKKAGRDQCLDVDSGKQILLTADEDCTCTGKLLDVYVEIPADLPAGEYTISFQVYKDQCFNGAYQRIPVTMPTVTLTVTVTTGCSHNNVVQVPEQAPTETAVGYTAGVFCNDCQTYISGHQQIPALGHSYEPVVTPPTCIEDGYTTYTCVNCGDSYVDDTVPATGEHTYGEWTVTQEATCTEAGVKTSSCTVCGHEQTEEIPAAGHTEETVAGKNATCTEAGLTEGKKCSVCGETLVAQEEIAAKGHTEQTVAGKDATCTEAGLTEGKICSVCDKVLTAQEEIPALGHAYESEVTAPTCTDKGFTTNTCTVCGDSYTDAETAATGHSFGEWKVTKEATKKEAGEETRTCACGETETREIPVLESNNMWLIILIIIIALAATAVVVYVVVKKKRS